MAAVVAAADDAVQGRFAYFGAAAVQFPGPDIDWNLDPRTGYRWPLVAASGIDHRTHPGDPKWIWELNRLQHLPWLAQAWLFSGDQRYVDAAFDQLDGWIAQNPTGRGIAWRGAFEAGVRAMSVAIALQGLRDAPGMTLERYQRVLRMLAASATYAWQGRSRFSSANNHLLGEMAGLATVAILHPELAQARRWESRAVAVLAKEADRQFLPDGAGAEQSSSYHVFAADLLVVPTALLGLRGDRRPERITDALRRSARYLRTLVGDGDPLPRYGDGDDGFVLRLHADALPEIGRHLAAVAALTGEPLNQPDLAATWLTGTTPAPRTHSGAVVRELFARDGGLVMLRRAGLRVTMDVGPLGYLSIAAHGHADALAVTFTLDGQDIVGDPGTGTYYTEPEWRESFRGTRMHPTASVDDLDQSVAGGTFLWTRHAATTVGSVDMARGVVDAQHDGYTRLDGPVIHRRYLVAPPEWTTTVVVVDLFTGSGTHRFRTAWPLAPDLTVRTDAAHHRIDRGEASVLAVTTAATATATPYAVYGDEQQRLGWWSRCFESRVPAWLVGTVVEDAAPPLAVASVFTTAGGPLPDGLEVQVVGDVIDVSWRHGSDTAGVRIDTRTPGAASYDLKPLTNGRT
ncbi:heparinase II/III domain-containing protein [Pseudonocardia sp. GCM10023141]|uniref:heparinase II/III domain-containing protein n=1 Tax=Pseudonocardia sp. GCM10023141 TaxID=3252653 RepID=UPI00362387E7